MKARERKLNILTDNDLLETKEVDDPCTLDNNNSFKITEVTVNTLLSRSSSCYSCITFGSQEYDVKFGWDYRQMDSIGGLDDREEQKYPAYGNQETKEVRLQQQKQSNGKTIARQRRLLKRFMKCLIVYPIRDTTSQASCNDGNHKTDVLVKKRECKQWQNVKRSLFHWRRNRLSLHKRRGEKRPDVISETSVEIPQ